MKKKSRHSKNNSLLGSLILIICIVLMIFSGIHILKWFKENKKSQNTMTKISDNVKIDNGETIVDLKKLQEENNNTVAWLKVRNTNIEYPVVKAKDNLFYLDHSFDNSYNSAGWIFADYNNKFDGTDKHLVIFGHNRRDGSMFGSLKKVLDKEWCSDEENRNILLVTEKGNVTYKVFSVYKIKNEDYYITTKFDNNEEFGEFINTLNGLRRTAQARL